ncbi:hypothetical protein HanIR_Chr03g0128501 [Helianthus annuus]|nr:hypothetical protein HanIR_Chr03g0128501 [Helianthus annuus]
MIGRVRIWNIGVADGGGGFIPPFTLSDAAKKTEKRSGFDVVILPENRNSTDHHQLPLSLSVHSSTTLSPSLHVF